MSSPSPSISSSSVSRAAVIGLCGTLSDGKAPFALNYPYLSVPKVSPACLTTGGSRKNKKASRKNKKASRKNRKASRKSSRKSSK